MKKLVYLFLAAVLALPVVSCNKDPKPSGKRDSVVDIGLVITREDGTTYNLKFAACNLGASSIVEIGDYYAWGETEPYYASLSPLTWKEGKEKGYDMPSYKYANKSEYRLTKYCPKSQTLYWDRSARPEGPDGLTTLEPADDAAHVLLGGSWRMMTEVEINALLALKDNPAYEWIPWAEMSEDGVSIHGLKIVQRATGNELFFPAGGFSYGLIPDRDKEKRGMYWTASEGHEEAHNALHLTFSSTGSILGYSYRSNGYLIRPVMED